MTDTLSATQIDTAPRGAAHFLAVPATRVIVLAVIAIAALAGLLATSPDETAKAAADADLTRLLRAMTGLKLLMAAAAAAAVLWRLSSPVTPLWFAAYLFACGAMFAGPGLVWNMAHVGLGALLLHAGLLATIVLVWRDPAVGQKLETLVARRRAAFRRRTSE